MLQSETQIIFSHGPDNKALGQLTIRNSHPSLLISFKIKTTKLDLFQVTPSKGFLDGRRKTIQISSIKRLTIEEMEGLEREKFMIEYVGIPHKLKEWELEAMWVEAKRGNGVMKKKVGVRVRREEEKGEEREKGVRKSDISLDSQKRIEMKFGSRMETDDLTRQGNETVQGVQMINESQSILDGNQSPRHLPKKPQRQTFLALPFLVAFIFLIMHLSKTWLAKDPQTIPTPPSYMIQQQ